MIYFELYDLANGGILDEFPSEADAFAYLRSSVFEVGAEAARGLSLVRVEDGERTLIARDDALEAMAGTLTKTKTGHTAR